MIRILVGLFLFLAMSLFNGAPVLAAKSKVQPLPPKVDASKTTVSKKMESTEKAETTKKAQGSYLKSLARTVDDSEETEAVRLVDAKAPFQAESDIPLVLDKSKVTEKKSVSPFQKMLGIVCTILLFGLVAFFFIHRSARRGANGRPDRNIKVLTQKSLGHRRDLMVVKIAGESILLGVTEQNINFIKNLSILDDELPQFTDQSFGENLSSSLMQTEKNEKELSQEESVDGYAVSKLSEVRDVVSKRYSQL